MDCSISMSKERIKEPVSRGETYNTRRSEKKGGIKMCYKEL